MKKTLLLTTILTMISISSFAQKRAALVGLTKEATRIDYTGTDVRPVCYLVESATYNDALMFNIYKAKIDSIMNVLGFVMIPQDSVLNTELYKTKIKKALKKRRMTENKTPDIPAEGFAHFEKTTFNGLLEGTDFFVSPANPEVYVVADYRTEINLQFILGIPVVNLGGDACIRVFTDKKNIFDMWTTHTAKSYAVPFVKDVYSCWGYTITEDIGVLQMEVIKATFSKLDEKIAKAEESVRKHYEKEAKKESKKK
jgi:hypothetical protein